MGSFRLIQTTLPFWWHQQSICDHCGHHVIERGGPDCHLSDFKELRKSEHHWIVFSCLFFLTFLMVILRVTRWCDGYGVKHVSHHHHSNFEFSIELRVISLRSKHNCESRIKNWGYSEIIMPDQNVLFHLNLNTFCSAKCLFQQQGLRGWWQQKRQNSNNFW